MPDVDPRSLSNAEIYVRSLSSSKGLACWQPEPFHPFVGEFGVVPGDVGTYSAEDGFKKTFNIWEDEISIRASAQELKERFYLSPALEVATRPQKLRVGDTIVRGASSGTSMCTVNGER